MAQPPPPAWTSTEGGPPHALIPTRADLHCHSDASNETGEALLNAIRCPESYSRPADVRA